MLRAVSLLIGCLMAQTTFSLHELYGHIRKVLPPSLSHARIASTIYLVDSMRYDTFGNTSWDRVSLTTYGYYPTNRTAWDSSFGWGSSQWNYGASTRYYYYTSGPYAGYDSLSLEWYAGSSSPIARTQVFYTSPATGYLLVRSEYSEWDNGQWVPLRKFYAGIPANRYREGYSVVIDEDGPPLFLRGLPPDSVRIEFYFNNAWRTVYKESNYFRAGQWDSTHIWLDVEMLFQMQGYAEGFVLLSYDPQRRLIQARDTMWICLRQNNCPGSGQPGPARSRRTFYFYNGNAPYPARDSIITVDYGGIGTIRESNLYTYDANNNLIEQIYRILSGGQWQNRERRTYKYIARQAVALIKGEGGIAIPTVHTAGSALVIEGEVGFPYALYDLSGRELVRGVFSVPQATIHLPIQSGIYVLRIGPHTKKLYLLP